MNVWKQPIAILAIAALMGGNAGTAIAGVAEGIAAYDKGDYGKAVIEFKEAAHKADKTAQYRLGLLYYWGEGVKKDLKEAAAWYRKAADQGDAEAQTMLGALYVLGEGVKKDYKKAVAWYRIAADQGNAEAQRSLGAMYDNGAGVEKNASEAAAWYRKAAEQGHAGAQVNLGRCYYHGIGVARDKVLAYALFNSAAPEGVKDSVQHRNVVETELSPQQLVEAQSISSALREKGVLPKESRTWLEISERSNAAKEPMRQAIQPQSAINAVSGKAVYSAPSQLVTQRCPTNPATGFQMRSQQCSGYDVRGHLYMTCNPTLKHPSPCNPTGR